ncbi:MAG: DUF1810 family protein [Muribaculaceae bacterium]|nr:DUF1810 family protein [Muribaculaceae bacterium]
MSSHRCLHKLAIFCVRIREEPVIFLTHSQDAGKRPIDYIMGSHTDVLKLQTSMKLFDKVAPNDVFKKVLEAFFR